MLTYYRIIHYHNKYHHLCVGQLSYLDYEYPTLACTLDHIDDYAGSGGGTNSYQVWLDSTPYTLQRAVVDRQSWHRGNNTTIGEKSGDSLSSIHPTPHTIKMTIASTR